MTDNRHVALALVGAQAILLAIIVWAPGPASFEPARPLHWLGWVFAGVGLIVSAVAALGLGRGLTPMPIPNEHAVLRTAGLYRFVRHPIYSALLLWAVGVCLTSAPWSRVAASASLLALFSVKSRFEEHQLQLRFDGYVAYAARTGRFLPRWRTR